MPGVWPRCGWGCAGSEDRLPTPEQGGGAEGSDFSGAAGEAGGVGALSREPVGLRHSPFLSHLCVFAVPFVCKDLVKSRQRTGGKNLACVPVRALLGGQ